MANDKEFRINRAIKSPEVRVVDDEGNQLGVMATTDAMRMAAEREMDLVEIQSAAKPPVCKIIDYGKFKFDRKKKEKDAKKNQSTAQLKEIKLRPNIEKHDYEFKTKHAREFLEKGDKVKITVHFRGREMQHLDLGYALINRVKEDLEDISNMEKEPKLEGRNIVLIMSPGKGKKKEKK